MARLTLLSTNDLHGQLTEAAAARLADLKQAHAPSLLFDSGDAIARGNVGWRWRGEWVHDLMRSAGYDAGALGNREYHFWRGPQEAKLRRASFPILCANVRPSGWGGTRPLSFFYPPGLPPVMVFGLLVPMITEDNPFRTLSASRFAPPLSAARELLASPSEVLVVVLSHLGQRADLELAAACPSISVILGGHSHTPMAAQVGSTWVAQGPAYGRGALRLDLEVDGSRVVDAAVHTEQL